MVTKWEYRTVYVLYMTFFFWVCLKIVDIPKLNISTGTTIHGTLGYVFTLQFFKISFNSLLLKIAIEIVDVPINSMLIFHSEPLVYQRVNTCTFRPVLFTVHWWKNADW